MVRGAQLCPLSKALAHSLPPRTCGCCPDSEGACWVLRSWEGHWHVGGTQQQAAPSQCAAASATSCLTLGSTCGREASAGDRCHEALWSPIKTPSRSHCPSASAGSLPNQLHLKGGGAQDSVAKLQNTVWDLRGRDEQSSEWEGVKDWGTETASKHTAAAQLREKSGTKSRHDPIFYSLGWQK